MRAMTEEERKLRIAKMQAIGRIRKLLLDGDTWVGKTLHETICLIDDAVTEEISNLCRNEL